MTRKSSSREDEFGFKTSSGVNYSQVLDRQIEDERFQRQRALRAGSTPVAAPPPTAKPGAQSATMDAVMRVLTGKEERTIADRISDPNRPTWEQYKRENADKLDLNDKGEKEMREYRKKLDAAREKALGKRSSSSKKKKKKKRSHSVSSSSSRSDSDSESDDLRRRSSRKSRRKNRKSRKRRRSSSSESESSDETSSDSEGEERRRSHKHKKPKKAKKKSSSSSRKKRSRKSDERSPSPVRLSSFLHGGASDSD